MAAKRKIAIAVWICSAAWALLFYVFWRMDVAQPHGGWAIATLLTTVGPTLGLLVHLSVQCRRRTCGAPLIAWTLIGVTPALWFGLYWLGLWYQMKVQNSRPGPTVASRVASTWALSMFELNAWWKFSRRVHGRHVVLIDHGQTPSAQRLVDEMDLHVENMAKSLGTDPPQQSIAWVRGSMFGEDGRASERWALCGRDGDPGELTALDRHEVAHALIFMLSGPDEDTPLLLVEGWAESQSVDRDEMIQKLANRYLFDRHLTLDELVQPPWYNCSHWPVYSHGGAVRGVSD